MSQAQPATSAKKYFDFDKAAALASSKKAYYSLMLIEKKIHLLYILFTFIIFAKLLDPFIIIYKGKIYYNCMIDCYILRWILLYFALFTHICFIFDLSMGLLVRVGFFLVDP